MVLKIAKYRNQRMEASERRTSLVIHVLTKTTLIVSVHDFVIV